MATIRGVALTFVRYGGIAGAVLAGLAVIVMLITTMADVVSRYFLHRGIGGVVELNETMMVASVFFGLALTQAMRGHIRVEVFTQKLSPRQIAWLETFVWVLCFAYFLVLGIQTWKDAAFAFSIKEYKQGGIDFPMWWAKFIIPLSSWMLCIQLLADAVRTVARAIGGRSEQPVPVHEQPSVV